MRSPDAGRGRAGFTLLEVIVALAVTGLVLLGARAVLSQLGVDAERIEAAAAASDRRSNGDALLRAVVGRTANSVPDRARFVGDATGARFESWCEVPAGWLEPCQAVLGIVRTGDSASVVLTLSTGEMVPLATGLRRARLRYLVNPGEGGQWLGEWTSQLSTPAAVGVEADDSLWIVPVGERG
jgi:prepilin-type N-terminal cleavage/methylation domain-containing protein